MSLMHNDGYYKAKKGAILIQKSQRLSTLVQTQERIKKSRMATQGRQFYQLGYTGIGRIHDRAITQPPKLPQIVIKGKTSSKHRADMKVLYSGTTRHNPHLRSFINKIKEQISKSLDQQLITYRKQKKSLIFAPKIERKNSIRKYQTIAEKLELDIKNAYLLRQKLTIDPSRISQIKKKYPTRKFKLIKGDPDLCPWQNAQAEDQFLKYC